MSHQQWRQPRCWRRPHQPAVLHSAQPVCTEKAFDMLPAIFFTVCFLSVLAKKWIILHFIFFLLIPRIARQNLIKVTDWILFYERHMLCIFRALILCLYYGNTSPTAWCIFVTPTSVTSSVCIPNHFNPCIIREKYKFRCPPLPPRHWTREPIFYCLSLLSLSRIFIFRTSLMT